MADFINNTWQPKENEIAVTCHLKELKGVAKKLVIQPGVKGILYHQGKFNKTLDEGQYEFDSFLKQANYFFLKDQDISFMLFKSIPMFLDIELDSCSSDLLETIVYSNVTIKIEDGHLFQRFFLNDRCSYSLFEIQSNITNKMEVTSNKFLFNESLKVIYSESARVKTDLSKELIDELELPLSEMGLSTNEIEITVISNKDLDRLLIDKSLADIDFIKKTDKYERLSNVFKIERKQDQLELDRAEAAQRREAKLEEIVEKYKNKLIKKNLKYKREIDNKHQKTLHESHIREIKNDAELASLIDDEESRKKEFQRLQKKLDDEFSRAQQKGYLIARLAEEEIELEHSLYRTDVKNEVEKKEATSKSEIRNIDRKREKKDDKQKNKRSTKKINRLKKIVEMDVQETEGIANVLDGKSQRVIDAVVELKNGKRKSVELNSDGIEFCTNGASEEFIRQQQKYTAKEVNKDISFRDGQVLWFPEMIVIPKGKYDSSDFNNSENFPCESQTIKPFAIGKFPVTCGQFKYFLKESGYQFNYKIPLDDDKPINCVSWIDATKYVEWLNTETSNKYYLPTEIEWEYACRGGSMTKYFFGDDIDSSQAKFLDTLSKDKPSICDVGSYKPNLFGLYDMHGNIWEWAKNYKPSLDNKSLNEIVRGGAWNAQKEYLSSSHRIEYPVNDRRVNVGFRVARSL